MKATTSPSTATSLVIISSLARLLPHPANFTPVGASSLLGGAVLPRPWNYVVPIIILLITDMFLGIHGTMPYVYGSFLFTAWLGDRFLRQQQSAGRVAAFSFLSSLVFFVVTNFGVWMGGGLYPKTFDGLVLCFTMGLPFWRNMLAGDLLFGVGFFFLHAWAARTTPVTNIDKQLSAWFGKA